ncbi:MAG: hypothetical protein AAF702_04570 [Chloroflexota bacterium]
MTPSIETVNVPVKQLEAILAHLHRLEEVVRMLIEEQEVDKPLDDLRIAWAEVQAGETIPVEELWDGIDVE